MPTHEHYLGLNSRLSGSLAGTSPASSLSIPALDGAVISGCNTKAALMLSLSLSPSDHDAIVCTEVRRGAVELQTIYLHKLLQRSS